VGAGWWSSWGEDASDAVRGGCAYPLEIGLRSGALPLDLGQPGVDFALGVREDPRDLVLRALHQIRSPAVAAGVPGIHPDVVAAHAIGGVSGTGGQHRGLNGQLLADPMRWNFGFQAEG
jgi:hypothetical protein